MITNIKFEEFKEAYMNGFKGYIPTYVTADEEYSKEGYILLKVEMIAPFRMTDGPSRFFRVLNFEVNKKQCDEIVEYFSNAGDSWKKNLKENIKESIELYSNNFIKRG